MAMQPERSAGPALPRGGPGVPAKGKPKRHEELGLCLALVVLLAWAMFVGLRGVNWSAVSHTFRAILALFF